MPKAIKFLSITLLVFIALYILGFTLFVNTLPNPNSQYSIDNTDGLVVFTGGSKRIETATQFLNNGYDNPVLISGVHPSVSADMLLHNLSPQKRQLVTLDYKSLSTHDNVEAAKSWAKMYQLKKLGLITSYYHAPRSLFYLKRMGWEGPISLYPVFPKEMPFSFMVREYHKYILTILYII